MLTQFYPDPPLAQALNEPWDPGCGRYASSIFGVVLNATQDGVTPAEYAKEDGTYNTETNHFLCDECYIAVGMPTASGQGWKCP